MMSYPDTPRLPRLFAALVVLLIVPQSVIAQTDNVLITKHNLSMLSGGNDPTVGDNLVDYGEVCVYCHTPHTGSISAPLWNRNFSSATYNMYDANHSSTIDMNVDAQPSGTSLACLSCHDGTIGLDVVVNAPNSYAGGVPGSTPGTNTMPASSNALLDTDLRNDHPISVVYDPAQDPAFNAVASVRAAGVKLFVDPTSLGEKVQCASCHNPHNNTNSPLLRVNNSGSSLCLTCHIK